MNAERQELHCHQCGQYVQFDIDLSLNGNHVLNCPNCGHEHCRVVENGRITGIRWDQRNLPAVYVTNLTITSASTFDIYTTASSGSNTISNAFLYASWLNTSVQS